MSGKKTCIGMFALASSMIIRPKPSVIQKKENCDEMIQISASVQCTGQE